MIRDQRNSVYLGSSDKVKMSLEPTKSATGGTTLGGATPKTGSKIKKGVSKLDSLQSETAHMKKLPKKLVDGVSNKIETSPSLQPNTEPPSPQSKPETTSGDVPNDGNNNSSSYAFTRLDVPNGFLPPAFKDCLLSNVLRSGRRSLDHLKEVRESLSNLVAEDEQLSKGIKKVNPSSEIIQLSELTLCLTVLTREAFVPTHRLNQTAIALYSAEDFLRYPKDIRAFDTITRGRIKVPDPAFNADTVQKFRVVVDKATEYYNKVNLKGPTGEQLQDIMFTLMRAFQDLYTLMLGCQEVFKVLLYTSSREKLNLQQFLLTLQSMERSDMLTEVQDLRRLIDELVIFLEKLSWGCFVVYRLASGKTIAPAKPNEEREGQMLEGADNGQQPDADVLPDFHLLQQLRIHKPKGKLVPKRIIPKKKDDEEKLEKTAEGEKGKRIIDRKSNLKVKRSGSSDGPTSLPIATNDTKSKKPKTRVKFLNSKVDTNPM